jgi:hypothetical protein
VPCPLGAQDELLGLVVIEGIEHGVKVHDDELTGGQAGDVVGVKVEGYIVQTLWPGELGRTVDLCVPPPRPPKNVGEHPRVLARRLVELSRECDQGELKRGHGFELVVAVRLPGPVEGEVVASVIVRGHLRRTGADA